MTEALTLATTPQPPASQTIFKPHHAVRHIKYAQIGPPRQRHCLLTTSVSPALLDAFTSFTGDPAAFALPVTITDEALTPLPSIPFATATNGSPFFASLPQLSPLLSPNTPLYLILRRDLSDNATASASTPALTIVTYIPSASPVRAKTLFASTRATLPRELGSGAFAAHVFAAEPAEVADAAVWRERDTEAGVPGAGHGGEDESMAGEARKREAMADEERQAEILKEEESKARGTVRRDIGIGGRAGAGHQVPFPVGEGVEEALTQLDNEGAVVQLVRPTLHIPMERVKQVKKPLTLSLHYRL